MGIYAIRDRASGHQLLGASRNVHASLNRVRFELRMGKHADRVLQAEWNRSGVAAVKNFLADAAKGGPPLRDWRHKQSNCRPWRGAALHFRDR